MHIRRSRTSGMTLLELMIASGMLALAMSMVFGSLISISVIGTISESRVDAANAVSSVLEQVRTMSYQELLEYAPPELTRPGVDRTVTLECFNAAGQSVSLPLSTTLLSNPPSLPNPLEIKATVIWEDEAGHLYSKYATTYVGR